MLTTNTISNPKDFISLAGFDHSFYFRKEVTGEKFQRCFKKPVLKNNNYFLTLHTQTHTLLGISSNASQRRKQKERNDGYRPINGPE